MTIALKDISPASWGQQSWDDLVEAERNKLLEEQSPGERKYLARLRRLHDLPLEAVWRELNTQPAPNVVAEAILVSVVERGFAALKEPKNIARLRRLNDAQRREVRRRLRKLSKADQVGVGLAPPDPSTQRFMREMEADPEFQRIWRPAVDQFHGRRKKE
jgi:hypothetical protein